MAILLMAFSTGLVLLPDSETYSSDTTIIKSHVPSTDNYCFSVSDDKEDIDEDGSADIQISYPLATGFFDLILFKKDFFVFNPYMADFHFSEVYLVNRQLLI